MKNQCCKTCLFSRWNLTPSGRISRETNGLCIVPVDMPRLPDCITQYFTYNDEPPRRFMGQNDGKNCPCWQENPGKPIARGTP